LRLKGLDLPGKRNPQSAQKIRAVFAEKQPQPLADQHSFSPLGISF
jgi:hypothetical protein